MTKRDEPREAIPADPTALEAWRKLPQSQPSKSAMPPMTGGMMWNRAFIWGIVIFSMLAFVIWIISSRVAS
jgi:hypothetical protein